MKAVTYCRVSTINQKEEKTIEIQEQALKEYADKIRFEIVKGFKDDGISGSNGLEKRIGLAEMFDYLEANPQVQTVLIYKLDRFARDLYIQEHLIRKLDKLGVRLISTQEPDLAGNDPMRKAFRQFMGIVSELEKAFITMRLSSGRMKKAKQGGYAGGNLSLGYDVKEGKLVINPQEMETVKLIKRLRKSGYSMQRIAERLNADNIKSKRNKRWYASNVRTILTNRIYSGKIKYNGELNKGIHDII